MRDTNTPASAVWWRDAKIRGYIAQLVLILSVIWVGNYLIDNMNTNLENSNRDVDFKDLSSRTAGFEIGFTPFVDYKIEDEFDSDGKITSEADTYTTVIGIAVINTLMVAFYGVICATILGFIMGVARLSKNWVVAKVASWYVEVFRNVPLLIQVFFCYSLYGIAFDSSGLADNAFWEWEKDSQAKVEEVVEENKNSSIFEQKTEADNYGFYVNSRGVYTLRPTWDAEQASMSSYYGFWIAVIIAIGLVITLKTWAKRRQNATGQQFPVFISSLGILITLPLLYLLVLGFPVKPEFPVAGRFNLSGGFNIPPEFIGLLAALSLYTAAFIAEAVRSGIQAVSKGQKEAAAALGIRPGLSMRLVVIPQALRVIIPQLTNQYLNLTKNSSLGAVIAYPEVVSLVMGTANGNTSRTVELVLITLGIYLTISLLTSLFMNWYNKKMALRER